MNAVKETSSIISNDYDLLTCAADDIRFLPIT